MNSKALSDGGFVVFGVLINIVPKRFSDKKGLLKNHAKTIFISVSTLARFLH
jgi:hypothetical protein